MLEFKPIELIDKEWVEKLLDISDYRGTEYCFTTLFAWSDVFNSEISHFKDWILLRSCDAVYANYLFPAGKGDLKEVIDLLIEDAASINKKFNLISIPSSEMPKIEELFPLSLEFTSTRDSFDYIYERESLSTLSGKKLQSKRNHISRFKDTPNWDYEVISYENTEFCESQLKDCLKMNKLWCIQNGCKDDDSKKTEYCAVKKTLENFISLKLKGGILRIDKKVVAYTIGERLNSDTFIIHIEKAFADIQGAYPMINQSFIQHETESFKYINREDDAGDEGLRKAKLSYRPIFMIEKFSATKK